MVVTKEKVQLIKMTSCSQGLKIQSQLSAQYQDFSKRVLILVSLMHISESHFIRLINLLISPYTLWSVNTVVARDLPEIHRESVVMGFWIKDQIMVKSRPHGIFFIFKVDLGLQFKLTLF